MKPTHFVRLASLILLTEQLPNSLELRAQIRKMKGSQLLRRELKEPSEAKTNKAVLRLWKKLLEDINEEG